MEKLVYFLSFGLTEEVYCLFSDMGRSLTTKDCIKKSHTVPHHCAEVGRENKTFAKVRVTSHTYYLSHSDINI